MLPEAIGRRPRAAFSRPRYQRKDGIRIKSAFLSQRERHILKTEKVLYIRSYITINKTIVKKELKKVYHR